MKLYSHAHGHQSQSPSPAMPASRQLQENGVTEMLQHYAEPENVPVNEQDRSQHPDFVRKKKIRVKVRMLDGSNCIGDCHVLWPDGRTSDVINDERAFLILTDATVEGEHHVYNVLTVNKGRIEMIYELYRSPQGDMIIPD